MRNYLDFYAPRIFDDDATANDKMQRMEQFFEDSLQALKANKGQPIGLPIDFRDLDSEIDVSTIREGRISASVINDLSNEQLLRMDDDQVDRLTASGVKAYKERLGLQ